MEDCELALQMMREDAARFGAFNATKCRALVWGRDGFGLGEAQNPETETGLGYEVCSTEGMHDLTTHHQV